MTAKEILAFASGWVVAELTGCAIKGGTEQAMASAADGIITVVCFAFPLVAYMKWIRE